MNQQVLARCTSCWGAFSATRQTAQPLSRSLRFASTQTKTRPVKKTAATLVSEKAIAASTAKKTITTKTSKAPTPTPKPIITKIMTATKTTSTKAASPKSTIKKRAEPTSPPAASSVAAAAPDVAPVQKTAVRTASSKTTPPASSTPLSPAAAAAPPKINPAPARSMGSVNSKDKADAEAQTPGSNLRTPGSQSSPSSAADKSAPGLAGTKGDAGARANPGIGTQARPTATNAPAGEHEKLPYGVPLPGTPEHQQFKNMRRRWIGIMCATPILLVTSYYLFDRLALGNEQKTLPKRD